MSGIQGVVAVIGGQSSLFEYGAVGWTSSPYVSFFKKQGTALTKLTDPASMPTAAVVNITWSRFGNFVGVLYGNSIVDVYTLSGTTVTRLWTADFSGIAASRGGDITHIAWTKERDDTGTNNYLSLFFPDGQFYYTESKSVIRNSNVFNDYGGFDGLGNIICAAFLLNYNSSEGAVVIARSVGAEYLFCVELDGFGSSVLPGRILTQPSVAPLWVASRNDGTAFAVLLNSVTNNLLVYTRSGADWDIANTLTVGGTPVRCGFSPDGLYLGVVHNTTPYYDVISFAGGSPVVTAATDALSSAGTDISMSRDGFTFLTGAGASQYFQLQTRNSTNNYVTLENIDFAGVTESAVTAVGLRNGSYLS
jgi:hypothetical protein